MPVTAINRRNLLTTAAGLGATAVVGAPTQAYADSHTRSDSPGLDLSDPKTRSDVYAKIFGMAGEGEVHKYWTVHYYAYLHEGGNMIPLYTMLNYNYSRWHSVGNHRYEGTAWEVGVYTDFDGETILDETWVNPVTGKEQPIFHFKGGPWPEACGPEGIGQISTGEDDMDEMAIRVIDDLVWLPTAASYNRQLPGTDSKGNPNMMYWDSYFNYSAKLEDILNPDMKTVPFTGALHNLADWYPGMGMEGHAGRVFGRAPGQKLFSIDDMPELAKIAFERHVPDIFDVDNWQPPRFG